MGAMLCLGDLTGSEIGTNVTWLDRRLRVPDAESYVYSLNWLSSIKYAILIISLRQSG